jgi:hypothetical protein
MPWKDPKSKEAIEYQKRWWEENKHKKNKEQIRENNRKYSKTEKGIKAGKIRTWRLSHNIKCDDWNEFYNNRWMKTTHCESCNLQFGNERCNRKNLDHQHSSGHIRNIICHSCNSFRSKYDKQLSSVLLEIHRYHFIK